MMRPYVGPRTLQRIGSVALTLVLALLAHDLLMATDVGGGAPTSSHKHHARKFMEEALLRDGLHPSIAQLHLDDCGPTMPVVSTQILIKFGPGVSDLVVSEATWVEPVPLAMPAHPPSLPPAARRALFQVYQI